MISEAGLTIIKTYEGLVDGDPDTPGLDPYLCPAGIPTIGYGSTRGLTGEPVTMAHPPIDEEDATLLMARDLLDSEMAIMRLVRSPLSMPEFSALASFTYNVGAGNLQASTLRMKLNRGDYDGAAGEFWKWRRAAGRILRGLVLRRQAEEELFRAGGSRYI